MTTLNPAEVLAMRVQLESAGKHLQAPDDDPLTTAYEYWMGLRTTLASPDVVIAAVGEILRLREEIQILRVEMTTRGQLYGRLVSELTDGQRVTAAASEESRS
jgi:hypothetical protein